MKILITGSAGFIGFHLAQKLMKQNHQIVGLDNINNYYDVSLKHERLKEAGIDIEKLAYNIPVTSQKHSNYTFYKLDLTDFEGLNALFETHQFDIVCNLAAQAGVRYSLEAPFSYIQSNVTGFSHILECCRHHQTQHLVYASSSSVYGLNEKIPYSTQDITSHPISLYAATKKSNEVMAHSYSHLYNIPTTGLRFFTVYGPWGRPDMAYFKFSDKITNGIPIDVYHNGEMSRDFTYIDDIVKGVEKILFKAPLGNKNWNPQAPNPSSAKAPYRLYNIGNNQPVNLLHFIETLENCLGQKATKNFLPLQPGDVINTWADVEDLVQDFDYQPNTSIEEGIQQFVVWYKKMYANADSGVVKKA